MMKREEREALSLSTFIFPQCLLMHGCRRHDRAECVCVCVCVCVFPQRSQTALNKSWPLSMASETDGTGCCCLSDENNRDQSGERSPLSFVSPSSQQLG